MVFADTSEAKPLWESGLVGSRRCCSGELTIRAFLPNANGPCAAAHLFSRLDRKTPLNNFLLRFSLEAIAFWKVYLD